MPFIYIFIGDCSHHITQVSVRVLQKKEPVGTDEAIPNDYLERLEALNAADVKVCFE